ncbi:unnamed protein product [Prunus brigantina]
MTMMRFIQVVEYATLTVSFTHFPIGKQRHIMTILDNCIIFECLCLSISENYEQILFCVQLTNSSFSGTFFFFFFRIEKIPNSNLLLSQIFSVYFTRLQRYIMVICTSAKLASHQKVLKFTPILEAAHFSSEMMIASNAPSCPLCSKTSWVRQAILTVHIRSIL